MDGIPLNTSTYCFHPFSHLVISEVYVKSSQDIHVTFRGEAKHGVALEQASDDASNCP